jgi:hypothetical protein
MLQKNLKKTLFSSKLPPSHNMNMHEQKLKTKDQICFYAKINVKTS